MSTIKVSKEKCSQCLYMGDKGCEMWHEYALPTEGEICDNFEERF